VKFLEGRPERNEKRLYFGGDIDPGTLYISNITYKIALMVVTHSKRR